MPQSQRLLTVIFYLASVCVAAPQAGAQTPSPPLQKDILKIVVLQGEGAVNSIKTKTAVDPVVEVRDYQDLPVEGAQVVFNLPASGPGAFFPNHTRVFPTVTNAQGQAAGTGLAPNDESGRFNIKVTATQGTRTASLVISQRNLVDPEAAKASAKKSRKWIIIAVLAGGAATGAAIGLRGGGSSSTAVVVPPPPNTISLTPGTITIGGPH